VTSSALGWAATVLMVWYGSGGAERHNAGAKPRGCSSAEEGRACRAFLLAVGSSLPVTQRPVHYLSDAHTACWRHSTILPAMAAPALRKANFGIIAGARGRWGDRSANRSVAHCAQRMPDRLFPRRRIAVALRRRCGRRALLLCSSSALITLRIVNAAAQQPACRRPYLINYLLVRYSVCARGLQTCMPSPISLAVRTRWKSNRSGAVLRLWCSDMFCSRCGACSSLLLPLRGARLHARALRTRHYLPHTCACLPISCYLLLRGDAWWLPAVRPWTSSMFLRSRSAASSLGRRGVSLV
jgi:hypothetical protein